MSKFKIGDVISVILILVIGITPFLFKREGAVAAIYVDGVLYREIPLTQNAEIEVNNTVIAVEEGKIFFKASTCRDKLCQKSGRLYLTGSVASCVPNGVTVEIEGGTLDADGVTW